MCHRCSLPLQYWTEAVRTVDDFDANTSRVQRAVEPPSVLAFADVVLYGSEVLGNVYYSTSSAIGTDGTYGTDHLFRHLTDTQLELRPRRAERPVTAVGRRRRRRQARRRQGVDAVARRAAAAH